MHKQQFEVLYDHLKQTDMFKLMGTIKENSPWHREDNILLHTDMVVGEYLSMCDDVWKDTDYLGAIACAFHDVGKPAAMIEKYSEARGNYLAFTGHEPVSSRLFEDWAAQSAIFTSEEIFKICWMIEYHVPWGIKDKRKRNNLALTANYVGYDPFTKMLASDQIGRISDDQEKKLNEVFAWLGEFENLCKGTYERHIVDNAPILHVPVAASGAGKTTLFKKLKKDNPDLETFSLDTLRIQWYGKEAANDKLVYMEAYQKATADETFAPKAREEFKLLVRAGEKDVYLDNTNLSKKRRAFYIDEAKNHGYKVVAYTLPCTLDLLRVRQQARSDKDVPTFAVEQQYMNLQQPCLGEVDEIVNM